MSDHENTATIPDGAPVGSIVQTVTLDLDYYTAKLAELDAVHADLGEASAHVIALNDEIKARDREIERLNRALTHATKIAGRARKGKK